MTHSDLILVVDDEPGMRRLVSRTLSKEGYRVEAAEDGQQMNRVLSKKSFDLVILDLKLPGEDGFSLARKIRSQSDVPIIMLTGQDELIDKVVGLEIGADDYITKPFNGRELVARVRAVLRRHRQRTKNPVLASTEGIKFSGWHLDFTSCRLTSPKGQVVPLTSFEYQVLFELASRPNRVLSRDQIVNLSLNRERSPVERNVDLVISKIRKKLNDDFRFPKFILTVRNQGYKFIAKVKNLQNSG